MPGARIIMHKRLREACVMFAARSIAACAGAARREHPIYWYDDYPFNGLFDLKPERMRALFTFGADCAMRGELWTTPEGLLQRSFRASLTLPGSIPACPGPK
jgi:hypothetical protein